MDVASSIGLDLTTGEVKGTIDQEHVLNALSELAAGDAENEDLFREAAARVQRGRSAGVEELPVGSRFGETRQTATTQLRYRSEMTDVFTDLAIDVGLRQREKLATVS